VIFLANEIGSGWFTGRGNAAGDCRCDVLVNRVAEGDESRERA